MDSPTTDRSRGKQDVYSFYLHLSEHFTDLYG